MGKMPYGAFSIMVPGSPQWNFRIDAYKKGPNMKRRDLVITALTGTAATVTLPRLAEAASPDAWTNVLFTEDNLGHWKGMQERHVPVVQVNGDKITVRTPHPMSEPHYIVSHTVVLADGRFINRKTFNWKDQPVSEHSLPAEYKGSVTVTSTCNLHDIWITTVKI
jgi:superoxide reductase